MVKTINSGVSHGNHTAVDGLGWVVEDRIVIWLGAETETCNALLTTVEN